MATQTKERTGGIVTAPTLPWGSIQEQVEQLQARTEELLAEALTTALDGAQASLEAVQAAALRAGRRFAA